MRTLTIILACVLLAGCATQKRAAKYIEKNPDFLLNYIDTLTTVRIDSVIKYKDKIVEILLPGDTITKDSIIYRTVDKLTGSVEAHTEFASSKAWIDGDLIRMRLIQHEKLIQFKIDSAVEERLKNIHTNQVIRVEVEVPPKMWYFYKNGFWIVLGLFLFCLIFLILRK